VSGHYQGLGGASAVATEALLDARELIGGVSDAQAMGAIYGPAGTGKSFAVTEVLTDRAERDWVHTESGAAAPCGMSARNWPACSVSPRPAGLDPSRPTGR